MTPSERAEQRDALVRRRVLDLLRLHREGFRGGWQRAKDLPGGMANDTSAVLSMAAMSIVKEKRLSMAASVDALTQDIAGSNKDSPAYRAMERAYNLLEMLTMRWACEQAATEAARR